VFRARDLPPAVEQHWWSNLDEPGHPQTDTGGGLQREDTSGGLQREDTGGGLQRENTGGGLQRENTSVGHPPADTGGGVRWAPHGLNGKATATSIALEALETPYNTGGGSTRGHTGGGGAGGKAGDTGRGSGGGDTGGVKGTTLRRSLSQLSTGHAVIR